MSSIPIRRGAASSSASVRFAVLLLLSPFYTSQAMSWTERRRRTVEVSASFNQQIDIDSTSFSDLSRSNAFGAEHDMIAAAAAADPSRLPDVCLEAGPCELCSDSDRISTPECRETGRRQSFRCRPLENTEDQEHSSKPGTTNKRQHIVYHSCPRTVGDDEFLLLRFQVSSLLMGLLAVALVRKQKTAAASLFDQRRLTSQKQRRDNIVPTAVLGGNATTGSSSVEMTNVNNGTSTKQISAANHGLRLEETKPLMSTMDTGDMDVV